MKFSEFRNGMIIHHEPVVLGQEEMIAYAKQYDPQWFHTDVDKAEAGRWGGLIGSGWLTCSLAMRMAVQAALHDSESFGSPGVERIRWMLPVRPGDALRLEITVDSVRVSSSREDLGIVRWTWRMYNQRDEQVLEVEATSLFDLAQGQAS
ncbi:MaoC family dehydratase [Pusillimonas noertemannii]|uniref:Acyl dehydratase n=1 Tax=Pusillimonas noertemannii TaxID=305977 RepID=A0A2U1CRB8_9BURK|nr:MaoC family dehydratase [Pusillimonas noertemannii]NYT67767.1 MaoC family dehydratase [Pusillimonas noertemannii]PVY68438.1 acyl dehydratase [Pusillimonas noertemannii]TFL12081.1 MaoC family dehydratase [Pusillimonas noertemannii]